MYVRVTQFLVWNWRCSSRAPHQLPRTLHSTEPEAGDKYILCLVCVCNDARAMYKVSQEILRTYSRQQIESRGKVKRRIVSQRSRPGSTVLVGHLISRDHLFEGINGISASETSLNRLTTWYREGPEAVAVG